MSAEEKRAVAAAHWHPYGRIDILLELEGLERGWVRHESINDFTRLKQLASAMIITLLITSKDILPSVACGRSESDYRCLLLRRSAKPHLHSHDFCVS